MILINLRSVTGRAGLAPGGAVARMGNEDENKKEDRKEEQEGDASAAADRKGSDGPRIKKEG